MLTEDAFFEWQDYLLDVREAVCSIAKTPTEKRPMLLTCFFFAVDWYTLLTHGIV
jgi:hypothetical protein